MQIADPYAGASFGPNALPPGHWANARMPYAPGMRQPSPGGMPPGWSRPIGPPPPAGWNPITPPSFGNSGGYSPLPSSPRPPMPYSVGVGGVASGAGGPQATMDPPMMRQPGGPMMNMPNDLAYRRSNDPAGMFFNQPPGMMNQPGGGMGAANGMPQDPAMQAQQHQQRIQEMQMKMEMERMKMQEIQMKNQGIGMQAQAKAMPGLVANSSGPMMGGQGGGMWSGMQQAYRQGQPRALQNWNNMSGAWQNGAGRNSFQMQNPFNASYQQSLGMKPQTGGFTRSPGTPEGSLSRNTGGFLNF